MPRSDFFTKGFQIHTLFRHDRHQVIVLMLIIAQEKIFGCRFWMDQIQICNLVNAINCRMSLHFIVDLLFIQLG